MTLDPSLEQLFDRLAGATPEEGAVRFLVEKAMVPILVLGEFAAVKREDGDYLDFKDLDANEVRAVSFASAMIAEAIGELDTRAQAGDKKALEAFNNLTKTIDGGYVYNTIRFIAREES